MSKNERDTKRSDLDAAIAAIDKEFGKGSIMCLGGTGGQSVECLSTGSLSLDLALGGGGIPRGRIVEIYGAEASGKTTVALHAVARVQRAGGAAAFIDAEHALDPTWAKRIGVNLDELLVSQPGYGEEGLRIAEMLIKSNAVDLVVVDSVAALVPKNEIQDSEIGDAKVGLQARLMSQAMRVLTPTLGKSRTCLLFVNQIRQKIGVMYGDPNTTPGGLALKFYAAVRMEVKRVTHVKDGEVTIGAETRVRVVKNKIAPPFRSAEFDILYDRGIDYEGDVLKLALEDAMIEKSGAHFSYKEQRLGHGRDSAVQFLRDNPAVLDEIVAAVRAKRKPPTGDEPAPADLIEVGPVEPAPKRRGKVTEEPGSEIGPIAH